MSAMRFAICAGLLIAANTAGADELAQNVVTLYRNSAIDSEMRVHVATFDTNEGAYYNSENCQIAAQLFQGQPGVVVRYWCEPGPYRQSWE